LQTFRRKPLNSFTYWKKANVAGADRKISHCRKLCRTRMFQTGLVLEGRESLRICEVRYDLSADRSDEYVFH